MSCLLTVIVNHLNTHTQRPTQTDTHTQTHTPLLMSYVLVLPRFVIISIAAWTSSLDVLYVCVCFSLCFSVCVCVWLYLCLAVYLCWVLHLCCVSVRVFSLCGSVCPCVCSSINLYTMFVYCLLVVVRSSRSTCRSGRSGISVASCYNFRVKIEWISMEI